MWRLTDSGLYGLLLLSIAMVASMAIIPVVWRYATHLGLMDQPDSRKVHARPIPRVGGWGICIGTLLPLLLMLPRDPLFTSYLIGTGILFLFGLIDDIKEISHYIKFIGQIAAAAVVVYAGDLWVHRFPFMGFNELPPEIGKAFTVFAMVGVINAINHSDGLDGLAAGEALLTIIVVAILAYQADGMVAFSIALACIGGLLGFLRFNTHPAQIFMGDTGSEFLGFTVGFLVVLLTQEVNVALSAAVVLPLIGLPIVDILAVLAQRIQGGMNWFRATRNHIHHRLLDLGIDHYETVVIIYLIQAALVLGAILMRYESDFLITGYYLLVCAFVFVALAIMERKKSQPSRGQAVFSPTSIISGWLQATRNIRPFLVVIAALVPGYVFASAISMNYCPPSFGILAGLVLVAALVELYLKRWRSSIALRIGIYMTVTMAVYYGTLAQYEISPLFEEIFFAILAIAIAIVIKFGKDKKFRTTPTDYLVVLGAVFFTLLTRESMETRAFAVRAIKIIILLYGCEVLIERARGRVNIPSITAVLGLSLIIGKALLV